MVKTLNARSLMLALAIGITPALALPTRADAGIFLGVSVAVAPPALIDYAQPPIPAPGYLWTPGYWAWGPQGYYWVPGAWELPPQIGFLWTPAWWGFENGGYCFHAGYWGPHVGFYGGIDYGFGYGGFGYDGGYWEHGRFRYNREANNFGSAEIRDSYSRPVAHGGWSHVSYHGGRGGTTVQSSPADREAAHERHEPATEARRAAVFSHEPAAHLRPAAAAFHESGTGHPGRPAGATESRAATGRVVPAVHEAARPAARVPVRNFQPHVQTARWEPPRAAAHEAPRQTHLAAPHPAPAAHAGGGERHGSGRFR